MALWVWQAQVGMGLGSSHTADLNVFASNSIPSFCLLTPHPQVLPMRYSEGCPLTDVYIVLSTSFFLPALYWLSLC